MTIKKYISMAAAIAALAAISTACSDNDDWTPGPETEPGNMTVYFGEMSSYNIIVEPDDSRLIPITIGRALTDDAATVDLIVEECPEGAIVPESVAFAAGQQQATVFVDIENMPSKSRGNFKLTLPENMTSPYGAGTSSLAFSVNISGAWITVANDVVVSTSGLYPDFNTKLQYLDGTSNFRVVDFLNSGVDMVFEMTNPGNGWTYIKPTKNYVDAAIAYPEFGWGAYQYDGGWFFYDSAADEYPYWSPDGVTYPEIDLIEFEDYYCFMQLIQDENNTGFIYLSPYIYFSDGTGRYLNINITFTTIYSPYSTAEADAAE